MRLLLINPRFPDSFWSFRWAVNEVLPGRRSVNPPLGLATLAGLCPPHWQVTIVDENVEPIPLEPERRSGRGMRHGCAVPAPERAARLLPQPRILRRGRRQLRLAVPGEVCRARRHGDRRRGRVHLAAVLRATSRPAFRRRSTRKRARSSCPTRRCRASTCSSSTCYSSATPAVLARLPVPLRVLRHHRHVRPAPARQEPGAGRPRAGRAARPGRHARLLRRRQPDRQPPPGQGAAALPEGLPGPPQLPVRLRHRGLAQPGERRGAAASCSGRRISPGCLSASRPRTRRASRKRRRPRTSAATCWSTSTGDLRQRHRRAGRLHHRLRQRHAGHLRAPVPVHHWPRASSRP